MKLNPNIDFYIEDNKVFVSEDLQQTITFLMEIENEIETVLGFKDKIKELYDHYKDLLGCTAEMAKIMKENEIEFKYNLKYKPEAIIEKTRLEVPIRSQLIILFASLEVLYFFDLAYENETTDENALRNLAMDSKNLKKFLNSFLLTEQNEFYKKDIKRFSKINSKMLRELRNSLTHFFSINAGNLFIVQDHDSEKIKKLEALFKIKRNKMRDTISISPDDLSKLVEGAHKVIFKIWDNDFRMDPQKFQRKIQFIKELVKIKGAYMVKEDDINL